MPQPVMLLWEHKLSSRSSRIMVVFYLIITLVCIVVGLYLIYWVWNQKDIVTAILTSALTTGIILRLGIGLKDALYFSNMGYGISRSHLHFIHGYLTPKETLIPIEEIKDVHVVSYSNTKESTMYFITDPPSDMVGYDFEKGENRHWPSFEMVKDPDAVINLINSLRENHMPIAPQQHSSSKITNKN